MDAAAFSALSLALGLGLLIGLQRERAGSRFGGIRTFPLIALLGAICGLLAAEWGALIVFAGLLGVISLAVIANLVFKAGVLLFLGSARLFGRVAPLCAAVLAAGTVILLFWP